MARCGLNDAAFAVSKAAGIHAVALAEFAVLGALYHVKGVPQLEAWQAERRWNNYATRGLAGRRALVVGLGSIGRQVAASFAALGVEVWGLSRHEPESLPLGVTGTVERSGLRMR